MSKNARSWPAKKSLSSKMLVLPTKRAESLAAV